MKTEMIIAGHGGQGVVELANNVSYYQMLKGRHVACTPSYGPESRGGKVKCYVVASDGTIDSPVVEHPDLLIVMNSPSMDYLPLLQNGGTLLVNTSLVSGEHGRNDVRTIRAPVTEIAEALKDSQSGPIIDTRIAANSVMLGVYLAVTGETLDLELMKNVFGHFLTDRKAVYIPLNMEAVEKGYEFAQSLQTAPRI